MEISMVKISVEDIDIIEVMSDSPKAKVCLALLKGSDKLVVFKEINCTGIEYLYKKVAESDAEYFPKIYYIWESDGRTMLIEEYISGVTLLDIINGRKLSEDEFSDYAVKLCQALGTLHHMEPPIIYRDLKPDNIIIMENKNVKLIDFDAAREYNEEYSRDTVIMGTRGYASPEQYGFSQTDVRSDIYSLGIVLAEMLNKTEAAKNFADSCRKIIEKATMFEPGSRYLDTDELLGDIRNLKENEGKLKGGHRYTKGACVFVAAVMLAVACVCGRGYILKKQNISEESSVAEDVVTTAATAAVAVATADVAMESLTAETTTSAIAEIPETTEIPEGAILIDEEHFPDLVFREFIIQNFDTESYTKGYLTVKEMDAVININIKNMSIQSVSGIEYFPNLEILNCNITNISSVDLSKNKKLKRFHCAFTNITELDLSNNPELFNLECHRIELKQLDLSNNPKLANLFVGNTLLEELDLSNNPGLEILSIYGTKIKQINLTNNPCLEELVCYSSALESLDISSNTKLEVLNCRKTNISELDLSNNAALKSFDCAENAITELDLSNNLKLTSLICDNTAITELDLSRHSRISEFSCRMTKVKTVKLNIGNTGCTYDLSNINRFDAGKAKDWVGAVYAGNGKLTGISEGNIVITCKYYLDNGNFAQVTFYGAGSGMHIYKNGVCVDCGSNQEG